MRIETRVADLERQIVEMHNPKSDTVIIVNEGKRKIVWSKLADEILMMPTIDEHKVRVALDYRTKSMVLIHPCAISSLSDVNEFCNIVHGSEGSFPLPLLYIETHHPEIIDQFASNVLVVTDHIIKRMTDIMDKYEGLSASEILYRGWFD